MISTGKALPIIKRSLIPLGLRLGSFHAYAPRPLSNQPQPVQAEQPEEDSNPKISIVTPSLNQGQFLGETIASVVNQKYNNLQYIVQDGGSTDQSIERITENAQNLYHWESVPDNGQSDAINRGFYHADGEIMAWLNADDTLLPGTLNTVARYFRENPQVDVVYGHRVIIDQDSNEVGRWILPNHRPSAILWRDYIPQETMFWRRSLWDQVGGYINTEYQFAMDWELVSRFHSAGACFARIPFFLGCFRTHDSQKSLTQRTQIGEREFNKIRQTLLPTKSAKLSAQISGIAYLTESIAWYWVYRIKNN